MARQLFTYGPDGNLVQADRYVPGAQYFTAQTVRNSDGEENTSYAPTSLTADETTALQGSNAAIPGTEEWSQQAWNSLPGTAQDKINASLDKGYGSLATWAAQRGLIAPQDLYSNARYTEAVADAQRRRADRSGWETGFDIGFPIFAGAMLGGAAYTGAGALGATGGAGTSAGISEVGMADLLGLSTPADIAAVGESVGLAGAAGGATGAVAAGDQAFTGGLSTASAGSPGLASGSFDAANLGAGGATSTAPGLTAPSSVTNAGALSSGSLAGESLYPVLGGTSAAVGATGLGTSSAGSTGVGTGTAVGTAGGTALSRVLAGNGSATDADWLSVLGTLGATGLGIYGANQQGDALRDIANQVRADRAPFLGKSTEYLNNPNAYLEGPGQASVDAVLRGLSVKGNPAGMPSSMGLATYAGLRDWRDAVTGFGNLGLAGEDSRNSLLAGAAKADSGALNSLGYGIGQLTNPPTTIESLLRSMRGTGASLV